MSKTKIPEAHVREIPTSVIEPNPHNPRRLFDEEPMQILSESIKQLGILVPLTLYKKKGTKSPHEIFILLDGERRWRCAQELKRSTVPAIVVEEPTTERNILTMFHIHNVRESWELMPIALKLEVLMDKFGQNERKLAELTKLTVSTIRRCKVLLSYPKKYQEMMLAPPSERWKADFFIELDRIRRPALEDKIKPWKSRGDKKVIDILVDKYEQNVIKNVTDFRKLAETYRACDKRGKKKEFEKKLDGFLNDRGAAIESVEIEGANFAKESKEIRRSADRLLNQIRNIDLEDIASDVSTIETLQDLVKLLKSKLEKALLIRPR